jgi:hypothetical protein
MPAAILPGMIFPGVKALVEGASAEGVVQLPDVGHETPEAQAPTT